MNNKIITIGLILTALNANAQNINNCDSTCFGNPAASMGVTQNTATTNTTQPQITGPAPSSGGVLQDLEGKSAFCSGSLVSPGSSVRTHYEYFARVTNGSPYTRRRNWTTSCSGPGCGVVTDSGWVQSFNGAADTSMNIVNNVPVLTGSYTLSGRPAQSANNVGFPTTGVICSTSNFQ